MASRDDVVLPCEGDKRPDVQTDANGTDLKAFHGATAGDLVITSSISPRACSKRA